MLSDIKFNVHYKKIKCIILALTFNGEKRGGNTDTYSESIWQKMEVSYRNLIIMAH